jgi:tRNA modification GTPase
MAVARVVNKIDLTGARPGRETSGGEVVVRLSAKTGAGIDELRSWLLDAAGWKPHGEGLFMARERHLVALQGAREHLAAAAEASQAFELMAEDLRLALNSLGQITGTVSADDLLGAIFSRFCVGK